MIDSDAIDDRSMTDSFGGIVAGNVAGVVVGVYIVISSYFFPSIVQVPCIFTSSVLNSPLGA
jgi:hypothetical protein